MTGNGNVAVFVAIVGTVVGPALVGAGGSGGVGIDDDAS